MIDVVIMASSPERRQTLQHAIEASALIRVVGAASSFPFLRSMLDELSAHAVVIDFDSSPSTAPRDHEWLREIVGSVPAVVLGSTADANLWSVIVGAERGALLRTDASADQIVRSILSTDSGLLTFDRTLVSNADASSTAIEELTPRETEVLALLAEGLANREIATRLNISEHTIKFHIRSILGKLGASTRTQAVTEGLRHGLIEL